MACTPKLLQTSLVKSTPHRLHRSRRNRKSPFPRVIRISVTDADATDSSSDDEEGPAYSPERRRVKRFISHVDMERRRFTTATTVTASSLPPRQSNSDDAVLVSRLSLRRKSRYGSAGGKTTSDSDTVARRRVRNWLDTYNAGPKRAREEAAETARPTWKPEPGPKLDLEARPVQEELPGSELTESFDSIFSSDIFACDVIVPSVLELFADPGLDQGQFGSLVFDAYSVSSSNDDFGFGFSGTTWPADEQILDIGEIFGSDPLVAI